MSIDNIVLKTGIGEVAAPIGGLVPVMVGSDVTYVPVSHAASTPDLSVLCDQRTVPHDEVRKFPTVVAQGLYTAKTAQPDLMAAMEELYVNRKDWRPRLQGLIVRAIKEFGSQSALYSATGIGQATMSRWARGEVVSAQPSRWDSYKGIGEALVYRGDTALVLALEFQTIYDSKARFEEDGIPGFFSANADLRGFCTKVGRHISRQRKDEVKSTGPSTTSLAIKRDSLMNYGLDIPAVDDWLKENGYSFDGSVVAAPTKEKPSAPKPVTSRVPRRKRTVMSLATPNNLAGRNVLTPQEMIWRYEALHYFALELTHALGFELAPPTFSGLDSELSYGSAKFADESFVREAAYLTFDPVGRKKLGSTLFEIFKEEEKTRIPKRRIKSRRERRKRRLAGQRNKSVAIDDQLAKLLSTVKSKILEYESFIQRPVRKYLAQDFKKRIDLAEKFWRDFNRTRVVSGYGSDQAPLPDDIDHSYAFLGVAVSCDQRLKQAGIYDPMTLAKYCTEMVPTTQAAIGRSASKREIIDLLSKMHTKERETNAGFASMPRKFGVIPRTYVTAAKLQETWGELGLLESSSTNPWSQRAQANLQRRMNYLRIRAA